MSAGARWAAALLRVVGALLAIASLAPFALAVEWLVHPGGIGMEWIAVPLVVVIGLVALGLGVALWKWANRLGRPRSAPK